MYNRLTVTESAQRLRNYHYAWYRLMHITAAWIASVPETFIKTGLGRMLYLDSLCADMLLNRVGELRDDSGPGEAPNADYVRLTNVMTNLQTSADRLYARQAVQANLMEELERHLSMSDPLWDEPTFRMVKRLQEHLQETNQIGCDTLPLVLDERTSALDQVIGYLDSSGGACGPEGKKEEFPLEAPYPLVDRPAREPGIQVMHASQFPRASEVSPDDRLKLILHSITFTVEITAVEICSQVIAGHPEIPWTFKMDLARQVWDEARHAELLTRRLKELGGHLGAYPIHIHIWEYFQMGDDLLEQLCIQQVIQEGHGLDTDIVFSAQMRQTGDIETAVLFDFVGADESVHVHIGCRWMNYLANGDQAKILATMDRGYTKLLAQQYSPRSPVQERERLIAGMSMEQVERARKVVADTLLGDMEKLKYRR